MNKQDAKYDRWVETKDGRMIGYILHGLDYRDKVEITNNELHRLGAKTATGMEITYNRCRPMIVKTKKIYNMND